MYPGTRSPAAALDAEGIVHLRGATYQPGGGSPILLTLPARLRPASDVYVPVTMLNGRPGRVIIDADGKTFMQPAGPYTDGEAFTSLEGVTFDAGD